MYILALASAPRGPYTTPSSKDEVATVFTDDELVRLVTDFSQAGLLDPTDGERLRDALGLGTRPVGGPRRQDHGLPAHQGRHRRCRAAHALPSAPPCTPSPAYRSPPDDDLTALRADDTHLAAVTGDKGTMIGFVTMEDVLSELFGPAV